jgi:2-polyprenyl-3-methyl-5-hydroxy-6-metoxy-1,4-benzoquinol methylase
MATARLHDDVYILHLRRMFAEIHSYELEVALSADDGQIPGVAYFTRSINYHICMVPWIESVFPLQGASVLEIGCGSGAATLPLAMRCNHVDAFDINTASLAEARNRAASVGLTNVDFHCLDPAWAQSSPIDDSSAGMRLHYDVVLLPAVLEHMLLAERLAVLDLAWRLLRPGGIMVVYDTPNRLHPFDMHSFRLPFFNWLPDDLALLYAAHSPRADFPQTLQQAADPMQTLYRLGRGVSYHEFDLAIGLTEMQVIQDGYSNLLTHRAVNSGFEGMVAEALRQHAPHVSPCFSREFLEFITKKKWHKAKQTRRQGVTDSLLDGIRPAQVIEGSDAVMEYDLGDAANGTVVLEVLRHPWSSELQFSTEGGKVIHREVLTADLTLIDTVRVAIPPKTRRLQLSVVPHPGALGNQAWILGLGLV